MYQFIQQQILDCEKEIEHVLQEFEAAKNEGVIEPTETPLKPIEKKNKKKNKNHPLFNVRKYLEKIHGVDVISIYGVSETAALEILGETGTDLSRWEHEDKFVSWLNLCPNNKISGGKLISSNILKKKPNLASQAFRTAANSLLRSDHWLGDYFRRMKAKGGQKYAIVATARKLAIIYYKMVRYKKDFTPVDIAQYQEKYRMAKIAYLERKLLKLKAAA